MAIGLYGDPAGCKGYIQIDGTNALQEQQAMITELKARIEILEAN